MFHIEYYHVSLEIDVNIFIIINFGFERENFAKDLYENSLAWICGIGTSNQCSSTLLFTISYIRNPLFKSLGSCLWINRQPSLFIISIQRLWIPDTTRLYFLLSVVNNFVLIFLLYLFIQPIFVACNFAYIVQRLRNISEETKISS